MPTPIPANAIRPTTTPTAIATVLGFFSVSLSAGAEEVAGLADAVGVGVVDEDAGGS